VSLVASLPWYDLPPLQPGLDAFWSVLRRELHRLSAPLSSDRLPLPLPDRLDRHTPLIEQWASPGLLLSQCCGPDLFTPQARGLVPIARPVFSDLTCTPGQYFSYIVSASGREPESRQSAGTGRFVINSASSRSGCAALFEWASANGVDCDQEVLISGAHAGSLEYLRNGAADLAAIDAHSWPLLDSRGITIIGRSTEAPTPPFVMHQHSPVSAVLMREALYGAIQQAGASINIEAVMSAGSQTYQPMPAAWHAQLPVGASPCCALI
jgi:ABC-type phosphate/phosphonate transport system substrate-binding protein